MSPRLLLEALAKRGVRLKEFGDLSFGFGEITERVESMHAGKGFAPVGYAKDSDGRDLINGLMENDQMFRFEQFCLGPVVRPICQCSKCIEAIASENSAQLKAYIEMRRVSRYDGEGREIT